MGRFFLLAMLALPAAALQGCSLYSCGDEVVQRAESPDGLSVATAFVRDCGATAGFVTHVAISPTGEPTEEEDKVLVAVAGGAPETAQGGVEVELRWLGPDRLLVGHHRAADVIFQAVRLRRVTVEYRALAAD